MRTRIYEVTDTTLLGWVPPRLIEATSASAAIRHVASKYKASVVTTLRLNELHKKNIEVEKAGDDD